MTSSVTKMCMKEVFRAARLFEPDRNEEKRTNEHAEKTKQKKTSDLSTLSFYDWLLSIPNYLHACVCFDPVCLSLGIVFCSVYWNSFGDYNRIRWVNVVQIVGYNTFVLMLDFSSDRSDPIQVVSNLLPLKSYRNCT